jgi:transposase
MARKALKCVSQSMPKRRRYPEEFRCEAVRMLLDGHTASSITERLGISTPSLLYRWKAEQLQHSGPIGSSLEERVRQLETELLRITRERDVLKKRRPFSAATSDRFICRQKPLQQRVRSPWLPSVMFSMSAVRSATTG